MGFDAVGGQPVHEDLRDALACLEARAHGRREPGLLKFLLQRGQRATDAFGHYIGHAPPVHHRNDFESPINVVFNPGGDGVLAVLHNKTLAQS